MRTTAIEDLWPRYYQRGYKPETKADAIRVDLLHGKRAGPAPDTQAGAHLSGEITKLERLGYEVERVNVDGEKRTAYQVRNLDHRPTAEHFAALREHAKPPSAVEVAKTNGSKPARARSRNLAQMLPPLAENLVVTAVGFTAEGNPFVVVTGPEGWRYSCTVESAEAPRS